MILRNAAKAEISTPSAAVSKSNYYNYPKLFHKNFGKVIITFATS